MKTEKKKQEKCEVELGIELDANEAKDVVKRVERAFVQQVSIPGFRKGKVPIGLIRRQFADGLKQEVRTEALRSFLGKAVEAEGLQFIALTDVLDFTCTDEGASITVKLDVRPTFALPTYKGLELGVEPRTATDADVEQQLDNLRRMHGKFNDVPEDAAVESRDFVEIDYSGTVDGTPIAEIAPDAKPIASGKGLWAVAGQDRPVPEIAQAIIGMKTGETKENVEVDFSKNPAPEALKDRKALYTVTVTKIRRQELLGDEDVAKMLGRDSIEGVKAFIKEQLQRQLDNTYEQERHAAAEQMLLQKVDFDVPETSVKNVMDNYIANLAAQAQNSGLSADYFEKSRDKIMEDARKLAVDSVRLFFLLEAIAKEEKLDVNDKNFQAKTLEFVIANAQPPAQQA